MGTQIEEGKMTTVKCLKCGNEGYLMVKQTVSKKITYQYWYVKHFANKKIKWCYIGKTLPTQYENLVSKKESTQTSTQNTTQTKNPNSNSISGNMAGGVGFEPTTTNLGGWCSVRTELPAPRTLPCVLSVDFSLWA